MYPTDLLFGGTTSGYPQMFAINDTLFFARYASNKFYSMDNDTLEFIPNTITVNRGSYYEQNGSSSLLNATFVNYQGKIHALGPYSSSGENAWSRTHYSSEDGILWTQLPSLPSDIPSGSLCVEYNNQLHCFGSSWGGYSTNTEIYYKQHSYWDGSQWTKLSALPVRMMNGSWSATVFNNKIFSFETSLYYTYDNSTWTSHSYPSSWGTSMTIGYSFVHDNTLFIVVKIESTSSKNAYGELRKFNPDENTFEVIKSNLPIGVQGRCFYFRGELHIWQSAYDASNSNIYRDNDSLCKTHFIYTMQ